MILGGTLRARTWFYSVFNKPYNARIRINRKPKVDFKNRMTNQVIFRKKSCFILNIKSLKNSISYNYIKANTLLKNA